MCYSCQFFVFPLYILRFADIFIGSDASNIRKYINKRKHFKAIPPGGVSSVCSLECFGQSMTMNRSSIGIYLKNMMPIIKMFHYYNKNLNYILVHVPLVT